MPLALPLPLPALETFPFGTPFATFLTLTSLKPFGVLEEDVEGVAAVWSFSGVDSGVVSALDGSVEDSSDCGVVTLVLALSPWMSAMACCSSAGLRGLAAVK